MNQAPAPDPSDRLHAQHPCILRPVSRPIRLRRGHFWTSRTPRTRSELHACLNRQCDWCGPIDRTAGGSVRVLAGPLRDASLTVAPDAHPGKPVSFTLREHEVFNDPADNFVSAWDDFEGCIGTQAVPAERADDQGRRVSEAIVFGPYRVLVNRPATITMPVRARRAEHARLRAFIYNEVSRNWEPVFPPAGSPPLAFDARSKTVSFDTPVFGTFLALATKPGWSSRDAVKNPAGGVVSAN